MKKSYYRGCHYCGTNLKYYNAYWDQCPQCKHNPLFSYYEDGRLDAIMIIYNSFKVEIRYRYTASNPSIRYANSYLFNTSTSAFMMVEGEEYFTPKNFSKRIKLMPFL